MNKLMAGLIISIFGMSISFAAEKTVTIKSTSSNQTHGKIVFSDTPHGLLITPELSNLSPGLHGFHLHENPDCANQGKAAGGHFDPQNTKTHQGPYREGHLGDLPVLYVDKDGKANTTTLAPRLKTNQIENRAVIIHEGGDTYSDKPELGGGKGRMACGIIK